MEPCNPTTCNGYITDDGICINSSHDKHLEKRAAVGYKLIRPHDLYSNLILAGKGEIARVAMPTWLKDRSTMAIFASRYYHLCIGHAKLEEIFHEILFEGYL